MLTAGLFYLNDVASHRAYLAKPRLRNCVAAFQFSAVPAFTSARCLFAQVGVPFTDRAPLATRTVRMPPLFAPSGGSTAAEACSRVLGGGLCTR
jgi:hypothetical protein